MDDPKRDDEKGAAEHPARDGEGGRAAQPGGAAKEYEIIDAKPIESSLSEPETPAVEEPKPFTPTPPPPRGGNGPLTAVIAGAIAGAVLSGALLWWFAPETGVSPDVARRLTALESAAATNAGLERRIGALEDGATLQADKMAGVSAYGPRLSALEAAAPEAKAVAEVSKSALSEAQAARADAANALVAAGKPQAEAPAPAPAVDLSPLEARLGKLEAGVAALSAAKPDLTPLTDRVAKLESALAAPKSEARVAPDSAPSGKDAGLLAVAAQALSQRIAAGAPYPVEQGALERLGADPARLAQLKPFADGGAPTLATLASDFAKITPALLSAAEPKSDEGIMARMMANMRGVVSVHPVGEQAGDDAAALVSQIGAALGRGDVAGALKTFARLPDASREVGKDWAARANSRVEAAGAAQALLDDALTRLGGPRN